MLSRKIEKSVLVRQAARPHWVDCLAADEAIEIAALAERGMQVERTEQRRGRVGQKLVRIHYQRQQTEVEYR